MSGGDARRAAFDEWLAKGLIDAAQHASMCLALGPLVQADVRGSGAIAQGDGAQAGGERALVVGPGNKGPVHQDNSTHLHVGPAGTSPAALRRAYLRRVWKQTDSLALLTGGDVRSPVRLGAVYTALLTARMTSDASSSPLPPSGDRGQFHRERRMSAIEVLDSERRLVLLGGPGSGKSTFVNFVAQAMAGELLGEDAEAPAPKLADLTAPLPPDDDEPRASKTDDEAWPKRQPWRHGGLLPVRVVLRDLAAQLPAPGKPVNAEDVWRYLRGALKAAALADYAPAMKAELHESGGLVMFDGLDEVPEALLRREQIQQVVSDFADSFSNCRVLVTSRTYAYQQQAWKLPGFAEAPLAAFTIGQIRAFVRSWYDHMVELLRLTRNDAAGRAALLLRQVEHNPRVRELAERPLLLTLFARLQTEVGGELPQRREELYFASVQMLLSDWERTKMQRAPDGSAAELEPSLGEWLKASAEDIRRELNRLAFDAHRDQKDLQGTADIRQADLAQALLRASANPDVKVRQLEIYLRDRAGILVEHGVGMLQFPHRTFQEYLAACHLANDDFPDKLAGLVRHDPLRWREVTLLAAAHAARGNRDLVIWPLVEELCKGPPMPKSERMAEPDAWGALLAGEVLVQSGQHENPAPRNRPKLERVRSWQLALLTDGPRTLPLAECVLAGRNLAAMGDPRPEVMTLDGMPFCVVPAGPFMMGEGEKPSRQGPVHRVDLPQVFAIGRWPVSTEQWREFVVATGHKVKDSNSLAGPGNQPANCIDWAEALRLCDYLTERWRSVLPPGWAVTMPSEAEWEKAARGGELIPATPTSVRVKQLPDALLQPQVLGENPWPTREYPWWQGFDGQPINTDNIIGGPSALGLGASCPSPYGCEEMAGNVWEWTRSLYSEALLEPAFGYPYDNTDSTRETLDSLERSRRIVRGGSWASTHGLARCACRGNLHPDDRDGGLGFRVVLRSPPVL